MEKTHKAQIRSDKARANAKMCLKFLEAGRSAGKRMQKFGTNVKKMAVKLEKVTKKLKIFKEQTDKYKGVTSLTCVA